MKLSLVNEARIHKIRYFLPSDIAKQSEDAWYVSIGDNPVIVVPKSVSHYMEIANKNTGAINKFYWVDKWFLQKDHQHRFKTLRSSDLRYKDGGLELPEHWTMV